MCCVAFASGPVKIKPDHIPTIIASIETPHVNLLSLGWGCYFLLTDLHLSEMRYFLIYSPVNYFYRKNIVIFGDILIKNKPYASRQIMYFAIYRVNIIIEL
ncbi:MAG: hypothetical protein BGP14_03240 [Sphingobacteriales bacterium 44-15]|nr:MAG: hypothetical protein BGP14_03240 [Sphingobacteriales bacterium 44-15]